MAIKMRILYSSNKGKFATLANIIKDEFGLEINKVDVIPPAYPCDKERIVIIGATVGNEPVDQLKAFCRELTKARTQNVALIIDGKPEGADKLKAILAEAGTNVIDEVFYLNCGGLGGLFSKKISDDEKASVLAWAHGVVDSLK